MAADEIVIRGSFSIMYSNRSVGKAQLSLATVAIQDQLLDGDVEVLIPADREGREIPVDTRQAGAR
jgi:hypothetical protein